MSEQQALEQLKSWSVSKLNAYYNHAWRENHNGIEPDKHRSLMDLIELSCGLRGIKITGRGGSWEMHQQ